MALVETAKGRLIYHLQHEIVFFQDAANILEELLPDLGSDFQQPLKHIIAVRRNLAEESRSLLNSISEKR